MSNKYKILVVEDESSHRVCLESVLEAAGYQVLAAEDCGQGLLMFASHTPDLVLLDLGLPDMDGREFVRHTRQSAATPILVVSSRTQESEKVQLLDLGADDYITKPFGNAELLARIRAALRNRRHVLQLDDGPVGKFTLHELEIDYASRCVRIGGRNVKLTRTEYNIAALLASCAGRVVSYAAIVRAIWGRGDSGEVKKLQVNIANIRKKLGIMPGDNRYIVNEPGVGYRMQDE